MLSIVILSIGHSTAQQVCSVHVMLSIAILSGTLHGSASAQCTRMLSLAILSGTQHGSANAQCTRNAIYCYILSVAQHGSAGVQCTCNATSIAIFSGTPRGCTLAAAPMGHEREANN